MIKYWVLTYIKLNIVCICSPRQEIYNVLNVGLPKNNFSINGGGGLTNWQNNLQMARGRSLFIEVLWIYKWSKAIWRGNEVLGERGVRKNLIGLKSRDRWKVSLYEAINEILFDYLIKVERNSKCHMYNAISD